MQKGFTLIEIVLSVALLAILFVMVTPLQFITLTSTRVDRDIATSVDMLRRGRVLARSGDVAWSVSFDDTDGILWRGDNFGDRDTSWDETVSLAGTTSDTPTTITFQSRSGLPLGEETITLVEDSGITQHTLGVNIYGVITY